MKKKLGYLSVLAAGALVLAGCGDDSSGATSSSGEVDETSSSVVTPVDSDSSVTPPDDTSSTGPVTPVGAHTDVNVFRLANGAIPVGVESTTGEGEMAYWAGDGGAVSGAIYSASTNTVSVTYTAGWAWYGVQLFYVAPYHNVSGTAWTIKTTINSSVAGNITINSNVITLAAGDNEVEVDGGAVGGTTLSVQLGESSTSTALGSGTISFKDLQVIDTVNSYYILSFVDADGDSIDDVYTMAGQTAWTSPTAPTVEGQTFAGWADEDGNPVDLSTFVPTEDTTLKATYATADASVSYYVGNTLIETVEAISGQTTTAPSYGYDEYGFGYGLEGWYTDAAFTAPWDFSADTVSGDISLYAKTWVYANEYYQLEGTWNMDYISHDEDGALVYSGEAGGWAESWNKQMNFTPVPVGESGVSYALTFEYKANSAYTVQIYDNTGGGWTAASMTCTVNTETWQTATLSFTGGTLSTNNKLTIEFGTHNEGGTNEFSIRNIAITAN